MPEPVFFDLPRQFCSRENSSVIIQQVPYEGTCTWGTGTGKGPEAIRDASAQVELYDIETGTEPYRMGICTDNPVTEDSSPEAMVQAVYQRTRENLGHDRFVITLGGEHSISIGAMYAHLETWDDLTIVQLDAHADMRDSYEGSRFNHACVMARAAEKAPIVQAGIRSMDISEKQAMRDDRVFLAQDITRDREGRWMDQLIDQCTGHVYLTLDMDVFDISIMPATGTPEPGGLDWYTVMDLIKALTHRKILVGMDVVELSPHEQSKPSDFLAAKLAYKTLAYLYSNREYYPWIKKIS